MWSLEIPKLPLTFQGQFEDGKMHGEGTYTWSHGLKYQVGQHFQLQKCLNLAI